MIDRNDPRLTAYALGEMNDAERPDFEKELANDPVAKAEVEAIRSLGGRLSRELEHAAGPALTETQRASVAKAARGRRVPLAILLMPVAACLLAAVALLWPENGGRRARESAVRPRAEGSVQEPLLRRSDVVADTDRQDDEEARGSWLYGVPGGPVPETAVEKPEKPRAEEPADGKPSLGFQGPNGSVPPGARRVPGTRKEESAPGLRDATDPEPPLAPPSDSGGDAGGVLAPATESTAQPAEKPASAGTPPADEKSAIVFKSKSEEAGAPTKAAPAPDPAAANGRADGKAVPASKKRPLDDEIRRIAGDSDSVLLAENRKALRLEAPRDPAERRATSQEESNEEYERIPDNPFLRVSQQDSSTFSIDVDTASYSNVRRFLLQQRRLPPRDAVRIEEMVNYFSYGYQPPAADSPDPFRVHVEIAQCPWDASHRLARVAIKGKVIDRRERPSSNLVFLVDVSGSMNEPNKLPLVQASLRLLAENLGERDRVAIVVYAGAAGLVLPSTGDKRQVIGAIDRLRAGGSTAGAAGIQLAYQVAADNFIKEGTNRVILCTDGDFNVGLSRTDELTRFIEEKAKSGVFLSVLGFGTGNYKDEKMQQLADRGNGNHAYIDSILEAKKVLGEELSGTLVTIAKDVKIQIFFNPAKVAAFRLIGYENRMLAKQDFNDDTKDAGEIGAGHSVTALYELVPAGGRIPGPPAVDENPFLPRPQDAKPLAERGESAAPETVVATSADPEALFQLRLRYKQPDGDTSKLIETMVRDGGETFDAASPDYRWAAAVASFGMTLRGTSGMGLDAVLEIAKGATGDDTYRHEFVQIVETAKLLTR